MKLAFIGIGKVGFALANNLQSKGYEIIIAHDNANSSSVKEAISKNPEFEVSPVQKAIDNGDAVFLATPFKLSEEILGPLRFGSKLLIDCTNPVGPGITHGLNSQISGSEKVSNWAGDANVVKAYSIYGFENLDDSNFPNYDVKPVMAIAGDNKQSKKMVARLNSDLGFETLDVGNLSQALHLEHMTLLWVKMVRANGYPSGFTWAQLVR